MDTISNRHPLSLKTELWDGILKMSEELGFADCGCARVSPLDGSPEAKRYLEAEESGHFGKMEYLKRNVDKRMDPALLLPDAKSVIVFLAPFYSGGYSLSTDGLKISEYALGEDYHTTIKEKLYKIVALIEEATGERKSCRVFTDSAPVLERAWAVRAGIGFTGKNNFLISPKAGIKNFIGVILTRSELPYTDKTVPNGCGQCTKCLDACTQKALYEPFKVNASKCLSYKTIEEPLEGADKGRTKDFSEKWIFGCDDCMNACPWNKFNKEGWKEFSSKKALLEGLTREKWEEMTEEKFKEMFTGSPLERAGLDKIRQNISR